jgi:hypothetical protein
MRLLCEVAKNTCEDVFRNRSTAIHCPKRLQQLLRQVLLPQEQPPSISCALHTLPKFHADLTFCCAPLAILLLTRAARAAAKFPDAASMTVFKPMLHTGQDKTIISPTGQHGSKQGSCQNQS